MTPSLHELSIQWCAGWAAACIKFKDALNDQMQKINDEQSQKALNELFTEVRRLEKEAMNEMPTLITIK